MPKAPADAAPSNQWLAFEPATTVTAEDTAAGVTIADPTAGLPGPGLSRPDVKASRKAWAAHALAQGAAEHEIAGMTKNQLIGTYGGDSDG